ncbi:hypothetical protein SKAU_G00222450 [Synaphobranchus kaupii]|uniref:Uncharacterized protein n=1 Tax=Synaphobranchus kaupii TaxID=118154 RepID=A0A9Q1IW65_SYNKA|nr:hypothetical protein SKAU_G00222450 [Synaphobranchus kaupii]
MLSESTEDAKRSLFGPQNHAKMNITRQRSHRVMFFTRALQTLILLESTLQITIKCTLSQTLTFTGSSPLGLPKDRDFGTLLPVEIHQNSTWKGTAEKFNSENSTRRRPLPFHKHAGHHQEQNGEPLERTRPFVIVDGHRKNLSKGSTELQFPPSLPFEWRTETRQQIPLHSFHTLTLRKQIELDNREMGFMPVLPPPPPNNPQPHPSLMGPPLNSFKVVSPELLKPSSAVLVNQPGDEWLRGAVP